MKELRSHELNFYIKYTKDPVKIHRRNVIVLCTLLAIAVAAGLAASVILLMQYETGLKTEIRGLKAVQEDNALMEDYYRAIDSSRQLDILDGEIEGMELFGHIKESYPVIGMSDIYKILECTLSGIHVTAISFEPSEGTIRLEAAADDVTVIPRYIDELKKTGLLINADYSGYSGNEKINHTEGGEGFYSYQYQVTVNMRVNPPETDYDFSGYETKDISR